MVIYFMPVWDYTFSFLPQDSSLIHSFINCHVFNSFHLFRCHFYEMILNNIIKLAILKTNDELNAWSLKNSDIFIVLVS